MERKELTVEDKEVIRDIYVQIRKKMGYDKARRHLAALYSVSFAQITEVVQKPKHKYPPDCLNPHKDRYTWY